MGFIVILILFGILLLLAEILLVPGVGVAGVLGLLSSWGFFPLSVPASMPSMNQVLSPVRL